MTWLYVLIDVFILLFVVALILVVLYFWNKKKGLTIGSLSEFRNNTIYEKSYEEQKKKAHIEEIVEEEPTFLDDAEEPDDEAFAGIYFSDGYGEEEVADDEN